MRSYYTPLMKGDTLSWLKMTKRKRKKMKRFAIWSIGPIVRMTGLLEEKITPFPIKRMSCGI